MQYSPSKNKWEKFSFSTKYKKKDLLSNLKSLGKSNSKTSKTLSNYSDIVSKANLSTNFVKSMREGALNDALNVINGKGERNIIDINSAGIWIKDANDENNQVYIGASCIGFTNDRWTTCKLAITSEGIVGNQIIGKLILGENLAIDSDNGCFYIGINDNFPIYESWCSVDIINHDLNFEDIQDRWSEKYINNCVRAGLISGFEDGLFRPSDPVTREQLCTIMAKMLEKI